LARGGLAAAVFALGARPTLRLRGPYFTIASIASARRRGWSSPYWDSFTGGASGLSAPLMRESKQELYFWGLGLAAAAATISVFIRRSPLGLALLAIRADVDAAGDVGISRVVVADAHAFPFRRGGGL